MELRELTIRPGGLQDLVELQQLYKDTIRVVCKNDYSKEQIEVWIAGAKDKQRWEKILTQQYVVVAQDRSNIAGFATLDRGESIDMFYIGKNYQRQGIAARLYNEVEMEARRVGKPKIISHVSKTALPFFLHLGFQLINKQTFVLQGIEIFNFKMEKVIV